jgi:hypothetical protein
MKNVQIIDGAENTEYAIHAFTDEEFALVFPEPGQNIEFAEDVVARLGAHEAERALGGFLARRVDKADVRGIHGTLFFELGRKKKYYPTKRDDQMPGVNIPMGKHEL